MKNRDGCRDTCIFIIGIVWFILVIIIFEHLKIFKLHFLNDNFQYTSKLEKINSIIIDNKIDSLEPILSQTTLILTIVGIGIAIYTIFIGFLSIMNINKSKELDDSINKAKKALENEKEIRALKYLQQGYVYLRRDKPVYAKECFEKISHENENIDIFFLAQLEIRRLYADLSLNGIEVKSVVDEKNEQYILKEIEKLNDLIKLVEKEGRNIQEDEKILSEINFLIGCLYGGLTKNVYYDEYKRDKYINMSIEAFKYSKKYSNGDPDIYRNIAITYLLKGDLEEVKSNLYMAIELSKIDVLYGNLVKKERLSMLFKQYYPFITEDIKKMLENDFYIKLNEYDKTSCQMSIQNKE